MALNWRKIFYPVASDLFAPHIHMKALADSVIAIIPVANTTERDALTASATAENPIYVALAGVLWTCNDAATWRRATAFAELVGLTTVPGNATPISAAINVTFPVGLFTAAPVVLANHNMSGATDGFVPVIGTVTAAGFAMRLQRVNGSVWSTAQNVAWIATQATAGAAAG